MGKLNLKLLNDTIVLPREEFREDFNNYVFEEGTLDKDYYNQLTSQLNIDLETAVYVLRQNIVPAEINLVNYITCLHKHILALILSDTGENKYIDDLMNTGDYNYIIHMDYLLISNLRNSNIINTLYEWSEYKRLLSPKDNNLSTFDVLFYSKRELNRLDLFKQGIGVDITKR